MRIYNYYTLQFILVHEGYIKKKCYKTFLLCSSEFSKHPMRIIDFRLLSLCAGAIITSYTRISIRKFCWPRGFQCHREGSRP